MQGRQERDQEELFIAGSLLDLIPEDHLLRRVDAVLDLSWLHDGVRDCYCQDTGRPSIDPESALRLMLAGFFEGLVHDRALLRRAQTDVAFRWFAGYRATQERYVRHRWRVEGVHGQAKTQHGLRRAIRRGLDNVAIQVYLTAAVMNLKRLAMAAAAAQRSILVWYRGLLRLLRRPYRAIVPHGFPCGADRPRWRLTA